MKRKREVDDVAAEKSEKKDGEPVRKARRTDSDEPKFIRYHLRGFKAVMGDVYNKNQILISPGERNLLDHFFLHEVEEQSVVATLFGLKKKWYNVQMLQERYGAKHRVNFGEALSMLSCDDDDDDESLFVSFYRIPVTVNLAGLQQYRAFMLTLRAEELLDAIVKLKLKKNGGQRKKKQKKKLTKQGLLDVLMYYIETGRGRENTIMNYLGKKRTPEPKKRRGRLRKVHRIFNTKGSGFVRLRRSARRVFELLHQWFFVDPLQSDQTKIILEGMRRVSFASSVKLPVVEGVTRWSDVVFGAPLFFTRAMWDEYATATHAFATFQAAEEALDKSWKEHKKEKGLTAASPGEETTGIELAPPTSQNVSPHYNGLIEMCRAQVGRAVAATGPVIDAPLRFQFTAARVYAEWLFYLVKEQLEKRRHYGRALEIMEKTLLHCPFLSHRRRGSVLVRMLIDLKHLSKHEEAYRLMLSALAHDSRLCMTQHTRWDVEKRLAKIEKRLKKKWRFPKQEFEDKKDAWATVRIPGTPFDRRQKEGKTRYLRRGQERPPIILSPAAAADDDDDDDDDEPATADVEVEQGYSVEDVALDYYSTERQFPKGRHDEGGVFRAIFLLLFFDIIYDFRVKGVWQTRYQESPLDFLAGGMLFFKRRERRILARLDKVVDRDFCWAVMMRHYAIVVPPCKDGETVTKFQSFTSVSASAGTLREVFYCVGPKTMRAILFRWSEDYGANGAGFPDLFAWNPEHGTCMFSEVKGPKDRLSPKQQRWMSTTNISTSS